MRKVTQWVLWLFVFWLPWERISLPLIGPLTYVLGIAIIATGTLAVLAKSGFRRPTPVLWACLIFVVSSVLSLLWTISLDASLQRAFSYAQLFLLVWVIQEFVTTREHEQALLTAFCVGAFVPMTNVVENWIGGVYVVDARFSAADYNANDLGLTLVLGIPMAWQLFLECRTSVRALASAYLILAPMVVLLTGSRGAFIAGIVALSIIPLTVRSKSLRFFVLVPVLLIAVGVTAAQIVPQNTWDRFGTIPREIIGEGTLTGRTVIWQAGLQAFRQRPILGVGAGAFGPAVKTDISEERMRFSHNLPLGILVEQGVVGLIVFTLVLATCAWTIRGLPPADRRFWTVLMLSWLVGVMSVGWEYQKLTWLLFGLLAARRVETTRQRAAVALPSNRSSRSNVAVAQG